VPLHLHHHCFIVQQHVCSSNRSFLQFNEALQSPPYQLKRHPNANAAAEMLRQEEAGSGGKAKKQN
jgi:hypothetical protein